MRNKRAKELRRAAVLLAGPDSAVTAYGYSSRTGSRLLAPGCLRAMYLKLKRNYLRARGNIKP